ncbi:MFS transporter [Streptomyces sp. NBC_01754]|uniref:MFS transporter n=1 Tax=Streptomyces sp. NBC_01754 TaxID=2975930 RepID=UPI002DDA6A1C|nr:MFS transporter [Streptomyces sp. NBC_01754]WSC94339.1 MFS transporter [Streptomyces sp. NBC_01754]
MTETGGPRAGRKEWIGLGVLLLPILLVSMDMTVLYFALPEVSQHLEPTSAQQLWVIDIYAFVLAGLLLTMGSLGDRIGRRRLLIIGAAAFGIASALAAYATSAEMLILARAVQGIGGATLMPSTLALIRNMFHDEKQRRTAIAVWSAGMSAGTALGPLLSGVMLSQFWWGSVFLINVPVMVLLLVVAPKLLPEYRDIRAGKFDMVSGLLSLAAVLPVIYGIKKLAMDEVDVVPIGTIALGLVFGALFVVRQRRSSHALLDISLFRSRGFSGSIVVNMVAIFAMVGFSVFTTQYLELVLGYSALKAALWLVPGTFAVVLVIPVATALVRKVHAAYVIAGAFVLAFLGFMVLLRLPVDDGVPVLLTGVILFSAGLAVVVTLITDLVMASAPPESAGTASATLQTGQEFGGALGIAILGTIGTAVYRSFVGDHAPAALSPQAQDAARETLGGALALTRELPADVGAALLQVVREAFTDSVHTAAGIAGGVMLLGALVSVFLLRGVKRPQEAPADAQSAPQDHQALVTEQ